ncbi:MAG: AraC family transcriptional regulator [bacterium]|nr:AraC family transcriptional regulator [bacterium]
MADDKKTMTLKEKRTFQSNFLQRAGQNAEIIRQMADAVPGVLFNIVDADERIVAFNRANCEVCNFKDEMEVVGEKVADLFPAVLAEAYLSLYREARELGTPILNRVTAHGADRSTDFRVANVFPLRDAAGAVIGTAVFYRVVDQQHAKPDWYGAIQKAVSHIDAHFRERLSLADLARISGMSTTTFRRVFAQVMEMTPGDYIATIRINRARKLLTTTDMKIFDIAFECGFYDQSHFIRTFKRLRKQTPAQYRRAHFRK